MVIRALGTRVSACWVSPSQITSKKGRLVERLGCTAWTFSGQPCAL